MSSPSEKHELLTDLLADTGSEDFRGATLEQGLALLRRRRARRRAVRGAFILAPLLTLAAWWAFLEHRPAATPSGNRAAPGELRAAAPKFIEGTSIRILSDAELLELFKDRPVALVGAPGGQKLLLLDEVSD